MTERDQLRRQRFIEWFMAKYKVDRAESRAQFMHDSARTGEPAYTKGRVSQFLDERQPFGEMAARNIATRFGLRSDYFEVQMITEDEILQLAGQHHFCHVDPFGRVMNGYCDGANWRADLIDFARALLERGPLALKPCKSPYCECEQGKCTHPGCYDARGEVDGH